MIKISARKLLAHGTEHIWSMFKDGMEGSFILQYDDEEVQSNTALLNYECVAWEFHRQFPTLPLLSRHGIEKFVKPLIDSQCNIKQHSRIWNDLWDNVFHSGLSETQVHEFIDKASLIGSRCCSKLYNMLVTHTSIYQRSFNIQDYYEVAMQPSLINAIVSAPRTQEGVNSIYEEVRRLIRSDELRMNGIILAIRIGACREAQFLQLVGCRGFPADIDRRVFPNPIMRGTLHGIRLLPDYITGSRDHAVAADAQGEPLKIVEYCNRSVQLPSYILDKLHWTDCRTTQHLYWLVEPDEIDVLIGKNYIRDDGQLDYVKPGDTHLIGKYIRLRSIFGKCGHEDNMGVCSTCFGQLSRNIPPGTNLGRNCMVELFSPITQLVLGTKHNIGTAKKREIKIDEYHSDFLVPCDETQSYKLSIKLKKYVNVRVVLTTKQASNLTDIVNKTPKDIERINLSRVTLFEDKKDSPSKKKKKPSHITLELTDSDGIVEEVYLDMTLNETSSSLSMPMLEYIQTYGYDVDNSGNFSIDMGAWDYSKPFVDLPTQHYDIIMFHRQVESFIKKVTYNQLEESDEPVDLLKRFLKLLMQKIKPNLAIVEAALVVYCRNASGERKGFIPKHNDPLCKITLMSAIETGSMGALFSYEQHRRVLTTPGTYLLGDRPNSRMDEIYTPEALRRSSLK